MKTPEPWPPPMYRRIAFATGVLIVLLMVVFAIWFFSTTPRGPSAPTQILPGVAAAGLSAAE